MGEDRESQQCDPMGTYIRGNARFRVHKNMFAETWGWGENAEKDKGWEDKVRKI